MATDDYPPTEQEHPPVVERKNNVLVIHNDERRLAGFIGRDLAHDRIVYTTLRHDHHYYRKGDGYAISESALRTIGRVEAERVIVHEAEGSSVYVFDADDYRGRTAQPVPEADLDDPDDPQVYVPQSEAIAVFDDLQQSELFKRPFDVACDYIRETRGWE
jgi:hypothetical protein